MRGEARRLHEPCGRVRHNPALLVADEQCGAHTETPPSTFGGASVRNRVFLASSGFCDARNLDHRILPRTSVAVWPVGDLSQGASCVATDRFKMAGGDHLITM